MPGSCSDAAREASVSPLTVWDSFATAAMSPAGTSDSGSCVLPRIVKTWPIRSSLFCVALNTVWSGRNVPEYTRKKESFPT